MGEEGGEIGAFVVESRPCRLRSRCPIAEASVFGLCLQNRADVSRGSEDRYPLRSARRIVEGAGLPIEAYMKCTNFLSEGKEITAFA